MVDNCPDCDIEMVEEVFKKPFGNPVRIKGGIPTEVCPKCGLRVVSEEHVEKIRRAIKR